MTDTVAHKSCVMRDSVVLWQQFTHTIDVHVLMMKAEGQAPQSWFSRSPSSPLFDPRDSVHAA